MERRDISLYIAPSGGRLKNCAKGKAVFLNVLAQSICTHYSNLSGRPDIFLGSGTLKKSSPKYGPEKSRVQKTGSLLFKKRRSQAASSLFE